MNIPIARFAPPSPPIFNYRDITQTVNGRLSYELGEGFGVEAEHYWFKSSGQWPLVRWMSRVGILKNFSILTLHVDYRMFSLDQVVDLQDNYEGSLITLGLSRGF